MSENNNGRVLAGVIALGVLIAAGADHRKNRRNPENGRRQPLRSSRFQVAIIEVKTSQVPVSVEVTGQVTPVYQATLASRIPGHD